MNAHLYGESSIHRFLKKLADEWASTFSDRHGKLLSGLSAARSFGCRWTMLLFVVALMLSLLAGLFNVSLADYVKWRGPFIPIFVFLFSIVEASVLLYLFVCLVMPLLTKSLLFLISGILWVLSLPYRMTRWVENPEQ